MIRQLAAVAALTRMLTSCDALATNQPAAMEKLMGDFSKTFEWIDFPEGRIRYSGGRRGRDEPPIDTFAVSISGHIYYGQISEVFLPDAHSYGLEVASFGWHTSEWPGTEPNPDYCATFTPEDLSRVQALVCQAIPAWRGLEDRPAILYESDKAHFTGEVTFKDGWALVNEDKDRA